MEISSILDPLPSTIAMGLKRLTCLSSKLLDISARTDRPIWKNKLMKHGWIPKAALIFSMLAILASPSRSLGQEDAIVNGLVTGVSGSATSTLTGYAITAIGLNSQSSFQTSVSDELSQINSDLNVISMQLGGIQTAIETQTCVDELSSSAVTNALTSIATVSNVYTNLLAAGESPTGTVSQSEINNFLDQVANGPGGGLPSISAALSAINISLQSTNNEGIIGSCESAVSSLPDTGSFGADAAFYTDPINLLQYFADYETVAVLLLAEYYNYEAFLNSPYYSAKVISNGLPATDAALVCANATGVTETECGLARGAMEQLYAYLQNQYSANGVPYSTKDSSGNLQTGLYITGNGTNYLFAASLEEFTNYEDIPQNNCPSVMTSSDPCGLTFSNAPTNNNNPSGSPFWSTLFNPVYQYETGWAPATADMWRTVLNAWNDGSSSDTVAIGLTNLGFQNAANKIIMTQTEYDAKVTTTTANNQAADLTPFSTEAVCFLDTNVPRSFSHQPWCYNGSNDSVDYGESGDLIYYSNNYNGGKCMVFQSSYKIVADTNDPTFYGIGQYDSDWSVDEDAPNTQTCPDSEWTGGIEPSWIVQSDGTVTTGGYFWPAIVLSNITCGTNLSYGMLQPALLRSPTNFLGVPTMCGADFDAYFADQVAPRNPFQQIVFTTSAVSGTGGDSASLGPITIQMQDTSSGSTLALTSTSDTTVDLSSSSGTGLFSLTAGGAAVTIVTIPSGSSSVSFYYGDPIAGTPQIIADPGDMVPGVQTETILSGTAATENVGGTANHVGSNKTNGTIKIKGPISIPTGINLQRATLTFSNVLDEDAGNGELVRHADGSGLQFPLVLTAIPESSSDDAVYETAEGSVPQMHVEVLANRRGKKHKTGTGKFKILVDQARINSAAACSSNPSSTMLHTRMIANDGVHASAVFDAVLDWKCQSNHKMVMISARKQGRPQKAVVRSKAKRSANRQKLAMK